MPYGGNSPYDMEDVELNDLLWQSQLPYGGNSPYDLDEAEATICKVESASQLPYGGNSPYDKSFL